MKCEFCKKEIGDDIKYFDADDKRHYHCSCHVLVDIIKTEPEKVKKALEAVCS